MDEDRELLAVDVECYAGHRGEQTPRGIRLGERRIEVQAVPLERLYDQVLKKGRATFEA